MSHTPQSQPIDDALIDQHLDLVLRASGSGLRHYSMELTRKNMREAMRNAMEAGRQSRGTTLDKPTAACTLLALQLEIGNLPDWKDEDGITVVSKERIFNLLENKYLLATVEPEAAAVKID